MINIFIGSHEKFERVEPVIIHSIEKHATKPVNIEIVRPEYFGLPDTGCTGFTNIRYFIPRIASGFAIYLDVDMILLSDISELYEYKTKDHVACIEDGSTEVCVIDCDSIHSASGLNFANHKSYHEKNLKKANIIPREWNCEDYVNENSKLLHFTDLKTQPWFFDHPSRNCVEIWNTYEKNSKYI